jgi:predicted patatin/cPLA2 family phospholipase
LYECIYYVCLCIYYAQWLNNFNNLLLQLKLQHQKYKEMQKEILRKLEGEATSLQVKKMTLIIYTRRVQSCWLGDKFF